MLSVRGVTKAYPTEHGAVAAVRGVAFELAEKEFFALLGPSGCGKTTTLRCVAGLERPDGGEISIGGQVVAAPARRIFVPPWERDIGMVFQSYAIWPHMSVFDNVAYPLRARREGNRAAIEGRVMDALGLVGMESMARRAATLLSGGQQQRVALARALVRRPRLLLLDEPLSNLDAKLREQMREEIKEMVESVGITTLYVTHDQAEALAMAERVAVMADGVIVQAGPPREVYQAPASAFVAAFLGLTNFLGGRVIERHDDDTALIAAAQDTCRLRLPLPPALRAASLLRVAVRPEDVELWREPPPSGQAALAGRVERIIFQGSHVECRIGVGADVVRTFVHPAASPAVGDPVWLTFSADRCVVLPPTEGAHGRSA